MNTRPPLAPAPSLPPQKRGGTCCAVGCLTLGISAIVGTALFLGGIWLLYGKLIERLTSPHPIAVEIDVPSDEQFAAANEKLTQIRNAAGSRDPVTVEFTAVELNALISRHPEFEDMRRRLRVGMGDSLMTVETSLPLKAIPLPRLRNRWFNGMATFGLVYDDGRFSFDMRSIGANQRTFGVTLVKVFSRVFDDAFNEGFDEAKAEDKRKEEFWANIESISVVDDKLIVTAKGVEEDSTL